ncbi:GNAT family N-acetyltransferase [Ectobacillus antri]|uniref:GNAT family N-acetyltransferase n=1 Tax=Ectobacillus antri TaxID=2486280 RepID=UPI000F5B267F|nr:GNAT family N-acetyltransferase [Ectobacillus antri]
MNTVTLVEINEDNWYTCCQLQVSAAQAAFLEPNAISILQAKFQLTLRPYAIYYGDEMAGFLMYNTELEELDGYWVYRIMIDKRFQGRGIGKVAAKLMLAEIAALPNARKIVVGYHPTNEGAHHLYKSLGFVDEGHRFGKEMAVVKYID